MDIIDAIKTILNTLIEFIQTSGAWGSVFACALISVESIIPIMPLSVFITVNFLVLGHFWGFIISYVFTVIGCTMSYFIFKKGLGNKFENLTENKKLISKYKKIFRNITTGNLILVIAMPFTPAFVVNIVAGLVKMDFKKYFTGLVIGKLAMVYFWGFVGTSLIESISNPIILVKIAVIMILTYAVYLVLKRFLKLD